MADQPKKSKSASAGDRLSWVIAMIKHSDITSVDWTKICEEVNCNSESTMQNRWKALRNEFLPGFTLKTMKAEDVGNAKPKPKSKAAAKTNHMKGEDGGMATSPAAGKRKKKDEATGGEQKKVRVNEDENLIHDDVFTKAPEFSSEEEHQAYLDEALEGFN